MMYLARVVFWWMWSVVKFIITPFLMIFSPSEEHWSWIEVVLITSSGAAGGAYLFFHGGEYLVERWKRWFGKKPKRVFNATRRNIIRIKWKFGLKGLMLFSCILSVPLSAMLVAKFYRHQPNALPMLIIGFSIWSVVLTSIAYFIRLAYS
jgi:hypothetical protein